MPRIEAGLRDFGHEITPHISEAELVYSNNGHRQIAADKAAGNLRPGVKVVLTVLDLPLHIPDFDYTELKTQLAAADVVCCISRYGQWQLENYLGIKAAPIIYQPIKPVRLLPPELRSPAGGYCFLSVGRRSDLNKRHMLAIAAVQLLGYMRRDVALVGNEPGWGDWFGVLSDANLSYLYNHTDFVLCTSKVEGLCLPVIEAMAAGAIPIVCNDMTTREELLPRKRFPEYDDVDPRPETVAKFIGRYANNDAARDELKARLHAHYKECWEVTTSNRGVAAGILQAAKLL